MNLVDASAVLPANRGRFITFEGIDGAGKSTHIAAVIDWLRSKGISVVATREPGGTPLGEKLRGLLLSEPMNLETETLLMFAARQEHLSCVIKPALLKGDWVVCDRFSDASYAYQGGGRGIDRTKIEVLERWVLGDLQPDLTFLFDLPTSVANRRRLADGRKTDRFEQEAADFHERVRQAYLSRAEKLMRFCVIDAERKPDEIKKQLEECILTRCL